MSPQILPSSVGLTLVPRRYTQQEITLEYFILVGLTKTKFSDWTTDNLEEYTPISPALFILRVKIYLEFSYLLLDFHSGTTLCNYGQNLIGNSLILKAV